MPHKTKLAQIFGLKIKIKDYIPVNHESYGTSYSGLAATQYEIKTLISQIRPASPATNRLTSTLRHLTALSSNLAVTDSHLLDSRKIATKYADPPHTWIIELLVPLSSIPSSETHPKLAQKADNRTSESLDPGLLLILRSQAADLDELIIPERNASPFHNEWQIQIKPRREPRRELEISVEHRREEKIKQQDEEMYHRLPVSIGIGDRDGWERLVRTKKAASSPSLSSPPSTTRASGGQWPRERETARKITRDEYKFAGFSVRTHSHKSAVVSQKDAETADNDFLATFSSLHDDVPPEDRMAVLDSVKVVEGGGGKRGGNDLNPQDPLTEEHQE